MWAAVLIFMNFAYGHPLLAWDLQKKHMKIITIGMTTNLMLSFFLIPRFSLVGAAVATITAELAIFFRLYLEFQKTIRINIFKHSIKPLMASLLMTLFLYICIRLNYNIISFILIAMLIYFLTILALKVFSIEDLKLLFLKSTRDSPGAH